MRITITANDGKEFKTKEECMVYENEIAKKEEDERAEKEHRLATKIKLRNDIKAIITELNEKVSEYRKISPCSIRYKIVEDFKLDVEFDEPGNLFTRSSLADLFLSR